MKKTLSEQLEESKKLFESKLKESPSFEDEDNVIDRPGTGKIKPNLNVMDKTEKPPLFKVIMFNDDYTPAEFVIDVLKSVFNKSISGAMTLMVEIHKTGSGVCGIYTKDIAETKVAATAAMAAKEQHPLKVTLEKE